MNLLLTLQTALLFYVLAVATHILICRFGGSRHFMPRGVLLGLVTTGALMIYQLVAQQLDLVGLYLFLAAWLLYLMVFINLLNSVTLKMLAHLHANPQGYLPVGAFASVFNANDGLLTRLQMMQTNGLLNHHGEMLHLTPKARSLLRIIALIGRLFSLRIG